MKRKIQIESGLFHQDRGSCGSHLDEPCPIHENSKHIARRCRILKKFRQPVIASHRHQLNQELSPDRLAFQVAHTTISPNYPGEEFETLDRQILVVSTDVPPQDGETDVQRQERENANAARAVRRQQEIAAPSADLQLAHVGQVNANAVQQGLVAPAGGHPPQSGPVFRAKTKQLTRAKFVSYFNLEQRFEQGAGGPAEGACEPEIAYAAWIWPFSLASNPAGPPEKIELP
jgi:hypothetical protein